METIIEGLKTAMYEKRKMYILSNGVEIILPQKLKGTSPEKRDKEIEELAEGLFNDVKRLKLL